MTRRNGLITTLIKQTLWDWACAHDATQDVVFFEQPHDDAAYPLRPLLAAFGLFPDAAPVRAILQTLTLGSWWRGDDSRQWPLMTGHQLLTLLFLSPLPVARRILALRQAGHLVGDVPSGVARSQAVAQALREAIYRQGRLPIDEECATLSGFVVYLPGSLPQLLTTLALDPSDPAVIDLAQAIEAAGGYREVDIWRFAETSPLPEAQAWHAWYQDDFLPALRQHHWYDPARAHALLPGQEVRASEFYAAWQRALEGDDPIDVAIVEEFEAAASCLDINEFFVEDSRDA